MRKRLPTALLMLLSLCAVVNAQRNFKSGYIITLTGDTIKGYIDSRGDIKNYKRCVFKENEENSSAEYSPEEIRAYRFIDGKFFISKLLKIFVFRLFSKIIFFIFSHS